MVATINQDAMLALICNQTMANITFLQAHSVIPHTSALETVRNELQNALNEINTRASFANLNVSADSHQQQPLFSGASSSSSYASNESNTTLVPTYGHNPIPPVLPSRPYNERPQNRAIALWDYKSDNNDDLNFAVHDAIIIDEEVNADWYKGHLESNPSKIGFFPSNYVRKEPNESVPPPGSHRFVAPHSQQYNSFPPLPSQNPSPQAYQQPYGQPAPGGYNAPNPPLQAGHASLDAVALTPVPYATGAMTTTVVTPGGTNAVVTDMETGKKNRFKLKPGGMGSTLAHSAVGGLGFGAGAGIAGGLIGEIFH